MTTKFLRELQTTLLRAFYALLIIPILVTIVSGGIVRAEEAVSDYTIKPGDVLRVNVWKEQDLTLEVLVRPDGKFSFPLAGDVRASGRTVEQVRQDLIEKVKGYIPEAVATVMVKDITGNKAYVVGKVLKPGPILMTEPTNVMQALSLAGGAAQFAGLKKIIILRGQGSNQSAIPFNYDQVESGEKLDQNVTLQAGDVVVVP